MNWIEELLAVEKQVAAERAEVEKESDAIFKVLVEEIERALRLYNSAHPGTALTVDADRGTLTAEIKELNGYIRVLPEKYAIVSSVSGACALLKPVRTETARTTFPSWKVEIVSDDLSPITEEQLVARFLSPLLFSARVLECAREREEGD